MSALLSDNGNAPLPEIDGVAIRVGGAIVAWFNSLAEEEDWATENYFGQWLAHGCTMPDRPALKPGVTFDEPADELFGIGIWVEDVLMAWFAQAKHGYDWAKETYQGQWQAYPCYMPNRPPFTPEQIAAAEKEAEKLYELLQQKIRQPRMLDDE